MGDPIFIMFIPYIVKWNITLFCNHFGLILTREIQDPPVFGW
jgi:hypothetical protein